MGNELHTKIEYKKETENSITIVLDDKEYIFMRVRVGGSMMFDVHPWVGTEHCLREKDGDGKQCVNDHTGCLWNDGHNACGHPNEMGVTVSLDSPLKQKETIKHAQKHENGPL